MLTSICGQPFGALIQSGKPQRRGMARQQSVMSLMRFTVGREALKQEVCRLNVDVLAVEFDSPFLGPI